MSPAQGWDSNQYLLDSDAQWKSEEKLGLGTQACGCHGEGASGQASR